MEPIIRLAADIKSSVKLNGAAFKVALELSDIIKSMQSETASDQVLQRTNVFFKNKLLPIYQNVTDLALQLASKLFEQVIRHADALPDEQAALLKLIPGSIASGILDFLEVDKKSSTRTLIARHFYQIICENYFPCPSSPVIAFEEAKAATLTAVYQLLSSSLVSHPENQSKLRDPTRLGGHRIGLALAKLRHYLSIEAILELFANLLPSARATVGQGKRAQFIEQVFRPEIFSNWQDIIRVLEEPAPDWTTTSQKLSDLIASKNPFFPQAFEIRELRVGNSELYRVERLYVDGLGFLASIDEGDSLGTIQILYGKIETFSVSNPKNGKTLVTVILKSPPIKNQQVMSLSSSPEMGRFHCVWEIKADDAQKMMNNLKQRKLSFSVVSQRKISVPGSGIEFSGIHPPHQSQANAIASLWSSINPNDKTSPIVMTSTTSSKKIPVSTPKRDHELHRSEMSTAIEPVMNGNEFPARPVGSESDPEDSPSQVVRKVTRKNKNALLVKSDSESDGSIIPEQANTPEKNGKVATGMKLVRQTRSTARAAAHSSTTFESTRVTALGKRKLPDERDNQDGGKTNIPPVKRPRVKRDLGEQACVSKIEKTIKPRPVRARRARESSFSPLSSEEAKAGRGVLTNNEKTRLSRMRNKDGRAHRTKHTEAKLPVAKTNERGAKSHEVIEIRSDKEDTDAAENVVRLQPHKKIASDVAKKRLEGTDAISRVERKETPKSKKAPWDEPAFISRIELSKNEIITSPMQLSEPQGDLPQEFDLRVWETTPPAVDKGSTPATSALEDVQKTDSTMEENLSEHNIGPLSDMQIPSVNGQAILRSGTFQAKTSVEIGIQVDSHTINSPIRLAARRPSSRFEIASTKLISKVPLLERSISIMTLTPQPKSAPNKTLLRIARPAAVLRVQRRPTTTSPKLSRSAKRVEPETVNSRIANILNEIHNVILCQIESKFDAVRSDWKAAHLRMLAGTQEKLQHMHQVNVDHYNSLVELYERYTEEHRTDLQLFDEMKRSKQEDLDRMKSVILKHNRHSLCKKFPVSLFASIPSVIQTRRYLSMTTS